MVLHKVGKGRPKLSLQEAEKYKAIGLGWGGEIPETGGWWRGGVNDVYKRSSNSFGTREVKSVPYATKVINKRETSFRSSRIIII